MNPYYQNDQVTLYCADCRGNMPAIDGAVVIADPPYAQTSLDWDKWQDGWPSAIPDCIKSLWCFGSMRMFVDRAQDFRDGGWQFSQDLVWEKHNGSGFHADRFKRVHESMCHFYRGVWSDIPKDVPVTMDATPRTVRRKRRPPHMGHIESGSYESLDGGPRLMRSVIYCRSMHSQAIHPTEKPIEIIAPLIQYGGREDATVIVPFAGGGAELEAAAIAGRRAIGFEAREEYCELIANRFEAMAALKNQPFQLSLAVRAYQDAG